jgi:hypothetical protein
MYPDIAHATIKGKDAAAVLNDEAWYKKTFIPTVAQVRLSLHTPMMMVNRFNHAVVTNTREKEKRNK